MKNTWIAGAVLIALVVGGATAQPRHEIRKARKEERVVKAKAAVAKDKAALKTLQGWKQDDKQSGDLEALRADRKATRQGDARLLKDEVKKGMAKVSKSL